MKRPHNFRILDIEIPLTKREQIRNRNAPIKEAIWKIRSGMEELKEAKQARTKPLVPTRNSTEKVFPGDPRYASARRPGLLSSFPYETEAEGKSPWESLIK